MHNYCIEIVYKKCLMGIILMSSMHRYWRRLVGVISQRIIQGIQPGGIRKIIIIIRRENYEVFIYFYSIIRLII